jgi:hypothetical protein
MPDLASFVHNIKRSWRFRTSRYESAEKSNKLFSVQFFEVYLQALFTNISQINIISGLFAFVGSDPVTLLLGRRVSEH